MKSGLKRKTPQAKKIEIKAKAHDYFRMVTTGYNEHSDSPILSMRNVRIQHSMLLIIDGLYSNL